MPSQLVRRAGWRYFVRHPWQLLLAVLGVATGVAVVLGIDLAAVSAERSFLYATRTVAGAATHSLRGGPAGLDQELYRHLRVDLGITECAPALGGTVRYTRPEGDTTPQGTLDQPAGGARFDLRLLGIDPFAEAPLRPWLGLTSAETELPLNPLLTKPGAVLLSAPTAARLGLGEGDQFELRVAGYMVAAELVGVLGVQDELVRRGLDQVVVTDIATAQEWLQRDTLRAGGSGRIDRIDLAVPQGEAGDTLLATVEAALPSGVELSLAKDREGALGDLTAAFRTNLEALSLLALVVGAFLIFNTLRFAVVQRRTTIGVLRALGATRGRIFRAILAEATTLGLVGTLLGLPLGIALASGLVGFVAQTVNDFYFTVEVTGLEIPFAALAKAGLLGLVSCIVAALVPARDATRLDPREVLQRSALELRTRRAFPMGYGVAAACGVLAALSFQVEKLLGLKNPGEASSIWSAYGAMFFMLLGSAALATPLTAWLLTRMRPLAARLLGTPGSLAVQSGVAGLSRTGIAVAALMLAVATTVGLGMMITSFRGSVTGWLEGALQADVFVSVPSSLSRRHEVALAPELVQELRSMPEVSGVTIQRHARVEATVLPGADPTSARPIDTVWVLAIDPGPSWSGTADWVAGDAAAAEAAIEGPEPMCWVTEPFAYRHGVGVGDSIRLQSPGGPVDLPIVAVARDYASEQGHVAVVRSKTWIPHWRDQAMSTLALDAAPGTDADTLLAAARRAATAGDTPQQLSINSSKGLLNASLEIFDRTFAVTGALRALCVLVAFLGIQAALLSLQLERRRELGLLRALGATPRQVAVLVLGQTGALGLCAGILSLPLGAGLGWLLAEHVNRRSFGWTLLDVSLPPAVLVEALLLAVGAALIAGAWPAWRLGRTEVASAMRTE